MKNSQELIDYIEQHAAQIIPRQDFLSAIASGKKLIIKLGMDPTAPDLHLGHAVVLSLMRAFQDAGHTIIVIIGNFTAAIGDPTGKSKTRPALSTQEIENNTQTYFDQVGKILDISKLEIRNNAKWLSKLTMQDLIGLCSKVTLARIIEREDFKKRLESHIPISMHELLYPLMQGYDSVVLKADVELGGTDQTFNLLMGRHLQEAYQDKPQIVITMPLLEGISGPEKMSKSLNNYISLNESAQSAYAKIMSIDDERMWHYYTLLTHVNTQEIDKLKMAVLDGHIHPMDAKKSLAHTIVNRFWSADQATQAQTSFEALFQKKDYSSAQLVVVDAHIKWPMSLLALLGLVDQTSSKSHLRRLIADGAIKINGETKKDYQQLVEWSDSMSIKVGKHQFFSLKK